MPVYCEAENLPRVVQQVAQAIPRSTTRFEIVAVDDGSTDKTWDVLVELADEFPELKAVRLSRNFGKELALSAGVETANGDAVIVMDADGQHPPSLLPRMIERWLEGDVEIVEGIKANRGKETLFSKLSAAVFYVIWNKLSGFELRGAADFKLLSRRAVNAYLEMQDRNVFFRGMTAWLGFRRAQIPFEVSERSSGKTNWSFVKLARLAFSSIVAFSAIPLHIVTLSGVLFLMFAFVFAIQTAYVYLSGRAVTGFATVIFLLLIIGSLLMISLGIIGEYLARIYEEVKGRPRYIVADVVCGADDDAGV